MVEVLVDARQLRTCKVCLVEKPLYYFYRTRYQRTCSECVRAKDRSRRASSDRERLRNLCKNYRHIDKTRARENDITLDWLCELLVGNSCHYCKRLGQKLGLDRIDNSRGHVIGNVVPCCADCNRIRWDVLSHYEMVVMGKLLAALFQIRELKKAS